jgi:phage-related protein
MATLPNIRPDYANTTKSVKPRIIKNEFGDGYSQRIADGINNMLATWDVGWTGRVKADIDTLEAFFETHGGYIAFEWTPERESVEKKFICTEWSRTYVANYNDSITAKFEEVSDL